MSPEYYLLHEGTILARVDDQARGRASIYRDGIWVSADHVAAKVTGLGGDSDFEGIAEATAKRLFPQAFKEEQPPRQNAGVTLKRIEDMTDAELLELLDREETPEEKAALDQLAGDPEEVLRRARERARSLDET